MDVKICALNQLYRSGVLALDDLSLTIDSGRCKLLGPNGTGKTTLMRIAGPSRVPGASLAQSALPGLHQVLARASGIATGSRRVAAGWPGNTETDNLGCAEGDNRHHADTEGLANQEKRSGFWGQFAEMLQTMMIAMMVVTEEG